MFATAQIVFSAFMVALMIASPATAERQRLNIYIDADFSNDAPVGDAIELGLRAAIAEGGGQIASHPITIVPLDHRRNPRRSRTNFQAFLRDPNGIAVFGGMQSPPYLTFGDFANESGIPLLLPWSAAAPVTRMANGSDNFIFRLSVDDSKAGPFLVGAAIAGGCQTIALALVDTGWGRANFKTMASALDAASIEPASILTVPADIGPAAAKNFARELTRSGAECVIAVLTTDASVPFFRALHQLGVKISVFSHWGFTRHNFVDLVPHETRAALDLRFLQTCGLRVEKQGSAALLEALTAARVFYSRLNALRDLDAPAGFVHGFDLGRILRTAGEQASKTPEWSNGPVARRRALRDALANLNTPVRGILKTYDRPFHDGLDTDPDGHEALGQDQLCLARYDAENRLEHVELHQAAAVNN